MDRIAVSFKDAVSVTGLCVVIDVKATSASSYVMVCKMMCNVDPKARSETKEYRFRCFYWQV